LALREFGRIERTLFTLDWLLDKELRQRVTADLNKGELKNSLAKAVCFNRLGELRDRSFEATTSSRQRPQSGSRHFRSSMVEHDQLASGSQCERG
jgi:TnpA family transposase